MTDDELLEAWYTAMVMVGRSPATIRRRKLTLSRFTAVEGVTLETADHHQIGAWLAGMVKVKPQTRGLYLGDLAAFYKWALLNDYLTVDPTVKVSKPKKPRYLPRPIPDQQLDAAIAAAPPRTKVMLTLAGYAGLRAAEIANLRCEDFDHASGNIRVTGKGEKTRIVPMHELTAALVEPGSTGPVVSWRGAAITPASVTDTLRHYLKARGLKATGHQARHSFGTRTYAVMRDLPSVQEMMGHESPTTTRGYVKHNPEIARQAVKGLKYDPGPPV